MTLNGRNVTLTEIKKNYGTHQKNLNEDRFILPVAKCRPIILVSSRDVFEDSMVEAKAKARGLRGQGQGHKILSSRSRPVFEDPHPWAFYRVMLRRAVMPRCLSVHHSIKFNDLLPPLVLFWSIVFMVLSHITILKNSASYGQILKPKPRLRIVKAKATKFCPRGPRPWYNIDLYIASR